MDIIYIYSTTWALSLFLWQSKPPYLMIFKSEFYCRYFQPTDGEFFGHR